MPAPPRAEAREQSQSIPTEARANIARALELFNQSEPAEEIAEIARMIEPPMVNASFLNSSTDQVLLTIAWKLSWYQFVVDLSDAENGVQLQGTGDSLDELSAEFKQPNVYTRADGQLALDDSPDAGGGPPENLEEPLTR